MNRRELIQLGTGAAVIAAIPEIFNLPLLSQEQGLPLITWPENSQTLVHRNAMMPLLKRFKENQNVNTLSPDEWDDLATHHQYYHGMHGESGHIAVVDTIIRNHAAYLKTKYKPEYIDATIKYGGYALAMRDAGRIHELAMKQRIKRFGSDLEQFQLQQGHLENAQYYINITCEEFFTIVSIWYGILSIVLGPEVGIIFAMLAIINDSFGLIGCNSGWF